MTKKLKGLTIFLILISLTNCTTIQKNDCLVEKRKFNKCRSLLVNCNNILKDEKLYLAQINANNRMDKIKFFFIGAGIGAGVLAVIGLAINFIPRK